MTKKILTEKVILGQGYFEFYNEILQEIHCKVAGSSRFQVALDRKFSIARLERDLRKTNYNISRYEENINGKKFYCLEIHDWREAA